ncbi:TRAP-type C4-dicarboxylate transport system, small permease component [Faunimonas pinastri]|uniref:TRAP transporter small permease protein n=1 Tax=Faunimonas pinastri TaxID=1855383 RepID=A0A1H9B5S6_9HYPH|nr:TRAP transporter small permease subunit [Faunimonas pinastri]SEP83598.1 TRAP-type C4-dicarboxylate transport system, small permease component [Faunimonas pinastri]
MRKVLGAVVSALSAICKAGTLLSFAVLICVVTVQVLGRVPGISAPAWTEEVARFALLYLVAFSCGLAALYGELVNVDLVTNALPAPVQLVISKIVDIIVVLFCIMIAPGAYGYVVNSVGERARSFDMPMTLVYVTIFIIPVALAVFTIARLLGFGRPMQHEEMI